MKTAKKILIVGAGVAGRMVIEQVQKENRSDIEVVGFVDDDASKQGVQIGEIPVLGVIEDLAGLVEKWGIERVVISTPSVGKNIIGRVAKLLPSGFPIQVLPSISSVILGEVRLSDIRDIDPSDLIGRPLVKSDQQFISENAKDKTILVTGGAGSIGSEIVRQLYDSPAKRIVVLDSWEEGIFNLLEELELNRRPGRPAISAYIGNIRDKERLEEIAGLEHIDLILHAAAYKHVPLMEENPSEAHKTNVDGTKNLLELAAARGIKDFVLISTDKAVNPLSVMGKSKREAELLMKQYAKAHAEGGFRFCAVRFGNVLSSSGSVIPKFLKQIQNRWAVTVTDLEMTRYFMSIPEAVSLVLLSWIVAKNGQILLLDMGEPTKILDLALNLIKIHGLEPYTDIMIQETGIRPGEKVHEELAYDITKLRSSPAERIFIAEEL